MLKTYVGVLLHQKQNWVRIGKGINKEPGQYAVLIVISGRNNNIGTVSVKLHQFLSLVIGQFSTGFHTNWPEKLH